MEVGGHGELGVLGGGWTWGAHQGHLTGRGQPSQQYSRECLGRRPLVRQQQQQLVDDLRQSQVFQAARRPWRCWGPRGTKPTLLDPSLLGTHRPWAVDSVTTSGDSMQWTWLSLNSRAGSGRPPPPSSHSENTPHRSLVFIFVIITALWPRM